MFRKLISYVAFRMTISGVLTKENYTFKWIITFFIWLRAENMPSELSDNKLD